MNKYFILILILMLFSFSSLTYDGSKCWDKVIYNEVNPFASLIGTSSSSTSYISSTGDCAAIGYHSKSNKELYFAQNEMELQLDIARGEGEYLSELSFIYGCSDVNDVNKTLMTKYKIIYNSNMPEKIIDTILTNKKCKYL